MKKIIGKYTIIKIIKLIEYLMQLDNINEELNKKIDWIKISQFHSYLNELKK